MSGGGGRGGRRGSALRLLLLAVLLLVLVPLAVLLGTVSLGSGEIDRETLTVIVLQIRLPRVLVAALVGAALALAGATMQGLFRNPMASPDVLGVSAGGSLGAVISITTGAASLGGFALPLAALLGSLAASVVVYVIATGRGGTSLFFVIIAGLAISSLFNGLISAALLFAREHEISRFLFWTMGGLEGRRWEHVTTALPILVPPMVVLLALRRELNLLMVGEQGAHALGLPVETIKRVLLVCAAVLTGGAVAISGTIGFVGLLVPHLLRLILGADHRVLIPASLLGGAAFLVACDLAARVLFAPVELRVGIVTALLGAPYLLALIVRYRGRTLAEPFR